MILIMGTPFLFEEYFNNYYALLVPIFGEENSRVNRATLLEYGAEFNYYRTLKLPVCRREFEAEGRCPVQFVACTIIYCYLYLVSNRILRVT